MPRKKGAIIMQKITGLDYKIKEMAARIKELREIEALTAAQMAEKTDVSEEEYIACESGRSDLTFAFIYRCASPSALTLPTLSRVTARSWNPMSSPAAERGRR